MYQSVYKHLSVVVLLIWLSNGYLVAQSFVTTWKTDNSGPSNDDQITIPTFSGETYNYDVDWGDGMSDTGVTGDITHTYVTPGTYTVSISGSFPRIYFDAGGFFGSNTDHDKILTVQQWGSIAWTSMASAFSGCVNLRINAPDTPDLSGVTDMSEMFLEAESLNDNINNWDVSTIVTMRSLFEDATTFNQPLNSWDVGNVVDMSEMFSDAEVFNQPLNSWDVGNVSTMEEMFFFARDFNQDLSVWVVDNVTNMAGMFTTSLFDQNISGWNVTNVTTMDGMFQGTPFNQPIGGWNVTNVTNMRNLFRGAELFNQDISTWAVNNVTNMAFMFNGAIVFNQNISGWNIGNVTNMSGMFGGAIAFNADITGWDVSGVTNMSAMFENNITFNQDISGWTVTGVFNMEDMFKGATTFNQNISSWALANVNDMSGMFEGAVAFNQDISGWSMGNVDDMRFMFSGATSFNQNLGSWDVTALRFAVSMLNNSGLSVENYDNTLIGWSGQTVRNNVSFGASNVFYCAGEAARAALQSTFSWFITDGGQGCITVYDGNNTSFPEISNGQATPIDFGSTAILPSNKSRSITIQNELGIDLTNVMITISGSVFSIVPAPPSTITASSNETINVILSGATPGTFTETLTITSDDFTGNFQFDLTGVITATPEPEIAVFEGVSIIGTEIFDDQVSPYFLGGELRGNDVMAEITLTNKGSAILNISNMSISGSVFSFASTTPTSVAVGATETVQIILDGSVAGNFTETLTITNDDTDEAVFNFDIQGGITGPDIAVFQGTDIFSSTDEIFDGQITSVDLGTSPEGVDATLEITIANFNPLDLNVSDISISGSAFSINSTTPFVIDAEIDGIISRQTFVITLSGASSGDFNETIIITNDDDDEPTFEFPLSGTIVGVPEVAVFQLSGPVEILDGQSSPIDFGSQVVGSGINETFTIDNLGSDDLTISNISISGSSFIINSAIPFPLVIGAGGNQLLDIFLPGSAIGTFTETVTIESDDADEAVFDFQIAGEITAAASPEIAVFLGSEIFDGQAGAIDIGTTEIGSASSQTFTINNIGSADLSITNISLTGSAFSSLTSTPFTIAPSGAGTFEVTLSGAVAGTFTETLTIQNNDADESNFDFQITGELTSSNNSPSISPIADVVIDEDGNTGNLPFTINDIETPSDDLIVTATSDNQTLVDPGGIALGGSGGSRTINITPSSDANGTATITVLVDDGQAIVSESFSLTVNAVNDAPIITGQPTLATPENTAITLVVDEFTVTDVDNSFPIDFSIIINDGTNYTINGNDVIPSPDFIGNLTVPIVINDGVDDSPTFDVIISVEEGEISVNISGAPLANGSVVNFDDIPVGAEDDRDLVITNTGSIPLNITEILIDGNDFRLNSPIPEPIAPSEATILSITFRPESIGPKTAILTIRSEAAADFVATLSASGLSEAPPLEIFNVVTVQQNDKHDFLEIRNIEFYNSNRVFIYSRWGNEVFKTGNYNNTTNRFIGNSDNGDELPDGTYYYVIELNGGETVENGFFLLRR